MLISYFMANQRTILILQFLSIVVTYTRASGSWNYYFFKKDSFATKPVDCFCAVLTEDCAFINQENN